MLTLVVIRARDPEKLATFYMALGMSFLKHRHGKGPEHYSAIDGGTVFEIYPAKDESDSTTSTRLGFSVMSLADTLAELRRLGATVLAEPAASEFGLRAVVKDFEGHKVELYEKAVQTSPS
jgi:predicted enzyme related to lactoylglutathione lyase